MSFHLIGPNNEFGTHDHDRTDKGWGRQSRRLRHESSKDGTADYYTDEPGSEKCCGAIFGNYHYHQCSKKGSVEYRGFKFCKTHHPPTVWAKNRARHEKWRCESDARQALYKYDRDMDAWTQKAIHTLERIASGELNDPVWLAQITLEERPVNPNPPETEK